jgi:pimeloyl-ACP methyl ester carboxylesterase
VSGNQVRQALLTIGVTATSRICLLRDRLLRRIPWNGRLETTRPGVSRHSIPSGSQTLDAVFVEPQSAPAQASLLLCHGIGEKVEHWHRVQLMLADCGIASLVFDYTGYGRSSGLFSASQAEQDAIAAFHFLERLTAPMPVSVLGLSLGTGIAGAILPRVPAHRLVLLGAFTSLREAAASVGIPRLFDCAVPDIWDTRQALAATSIPILIVQGAKDCLFPVSMAEELAGRCGSNCELVVVPGLGHNEPFYDPRLSYWGDIVARFLLQGG